MNTPELDEEQFDRTGSLYPQPPSIFDNLPPVDDFIDTELRKPGKWVKRSGFEVYITEDDSNE